MISPLLPAVGEREMCISMVNVISGVYMAARDGT